MKLVNARSFSEYSSSESATSRLSRRSPSGASDAGADSMRCALFEIGLLASVVEEEDAAVPLEFDEAVGSGNDGFPDE